MRIDLNKTLERIEKSLPREGEITFGMLEKAYEQTLRLRSQLLGIMYDMMDFGSATKAPEAFAQNESDRIVRLLIPEPLPGLKELTAAVEEHWVRMIHEAISQQAQTGIPYFEKAFVLIRIHAPRGTNNAKVWDTSNRAINVVINNLKGIFFEDDNFEHMACGVIADWGEIGQTEIRICDLEDLKKCGIFRKTGLEL